MLESGIPSGKMARRMKCNQESDQRGGFRGAQVFSIGRHIATTLNDLPDELILRKTQRDGVERRPTLAACIAERVAVAALLELEDQRALAFERSGVLEKLLGDGISAPGIHHGAPGSIARQVRKGAEHDGDEHDA